MALKELKTKHSNYCAFCRRRTPHIVDKTHVMCKRCGKIYKRRK